MRLMSRWLSVGLIALAAVVRADAPEVTITKIENLPNRLFYFDDTPVSLRLTVGQPKLFRIVVLMVWVS